MLRRPSLRDLRDLREHAPGDSEDERAAWVADAVRRLSGVEVAAGDVPACAVDPGAVADLIDHWRYVPAGPWRKVPAGAGTPEGGPLAGTWLAEFAPLYEALAAKGIGPREADAMEVWEVAAALGVLSSEAQDPERDLIAERVAARRAGLPPPRLGPQDSGAATLTKMLAEHG